MAGLGYGRFTRWPLKRGAVSAALLSLMLSNATAAPGDARPLPPPQAVAEPAPAAPPPPSEARAPTPHGSMQPGRGLL